MPLNISIIRFQIVQKKTHTHNRFGFRPKHLRFMTMHGRKKLLQSRIESLDLRMRSPNRDQSDLNKHNND